VGGICHTQKFWRGAPYDGFTQNVVATPLKLYFDAKTAQPNTERKRKLVVKKQ